MFFMSFSSFLILWKECFQNWYWKAGICGIWISKLTNVSFNNSVELDDDFSLIFHNKQRKYSLSLTSVLSHCSWQHTHSWFYFVDSVCSEWSTSYEKYLMSFSNNPLNSMITSVNLSPEDKFTLVLFLKLAAATSMIVILRGILSIQECCSMVPHPT